VNNIIGRIADNFPVFQLIDSRIDDDQTGMNHIPLNHIAATHRNKCDIGVTEVQGDVRCAGMTHRHGCIFPLQHMKKRQTDGLTSANQGDIFALEGITIMLQQSDTRLRSGGIKTRIPCHHSQLIAGCNAVNIFQGEEGLYDLACRQVTGQGEFQHDPVDGRIIIQSGNPLQDFFFGGIRFEGMENKGDAQLFRDFLFCFHIMLGRRVPSTMIVAMRG